MLQVINWLSLLLPPLFFILLLVLVAQLHIANMINRLEPQHGRGLA